MGEVNNFITDLLDEMADNDAVALRLAGGMVPSYRLAGGLVPYDRIKENIIVVSRYKPVPSEEIFEDMEALGIKIEKKRNFYYLHTPEAKPENLLKLKTQVNLINGVPTVHFMRSTN